MWLSGKLRLNMLMVVLSSWALSSCCMAYTGLCSKYNAALDKDFVAEGLLNVVITLGWKEVTVVHDSSPETVATVDTVIPRLHIKGVFSTLVQSKSSVFLQSQEDTDNRLAAFLILGSVDFVEGVLQSTANLTLLTMRHTWEGSLLSVVASPFRPSHLLTRHSIFPNPSCALCSRKLRVVVKEYDNYVFASNKSSTTVYLGILIDLLEELSLRLNFSFTLMPPVDDSWGQELDNGQWDGPIGMLTRQEADLAVSPFTVTLSRMVVAEAVHFMADQFIIIFSQRAPAPSAWAVYLKPFNTLVYLVLLATLVGVLLLLLVVERCQGVVEKAKEVGKGQGRKTSTIEQIIADVEMLMSGLLNKPLEQESRSRAGRVLVMTWLVMGVILTSVYSSQLTSSLTVSQQTLHFNSLTQLMSQEDYTWGLTKGTAVESILKNTTDGQLQMFYAKVQDFAQTDPSVLSRDYETHKRKVLTSNYAWMTSLSVYEAWKLSECNIRMIPEAYTSLPLGLFLQKGSPYKDMMATQISRMVDHGLLHHWMQKWSPERRHCHPDGDAKGKVITLADTQSAFSLAALGLGMAFLILGIERLVSFMSEWRDKRDVCT